MWSAGAALDENLVLGQKLGEGPQLTDGESVRANDGKGRFHGSFRWQACRYGYQGGESGEQVVDVVDQAPYNAPSNGAGGRRIGERCTGILEGRNQTPLLSGSAGPWPAATA